jgi:hypothetical protein
MRFVRLTMLATVAATALMFSGCTAALFSVMYLIKGADTPAEFDGLSEKKVAVVCRPLVGLDYREAGVAQDIARSVNRLVRLNVRKVETVDQRKIAEWMDENSWEDYLEVGKAVGADMVVGIDLEEFHLYKGQTVYQGKATALVKVYDCQSNELVFEKRVPQVIWPPSPRAVAEQPEADFTREYVAVLSDRVARYFYAFDPRNDYALTARSMD